MKRRFYLLVMSILSFCLSAAGQTETRIEVSSVSGTSDIGDILVYGNVFRYPTITMAEGSVVKEHFSQFLKENASGEFVSFQGPVFGKGKYKIQTQVAIKGEAYKTHKLAEGWTLTVDGKQWTTLEGIYDLGEMILAQAISPEITVEATEMPLAFKDTPYFDVPASIAGTAIKPYSVAGGVVGGTEPYTFSKTSGPEWLSVAADGTVSGTPKAFGTNADMVIRVTDSKNEYKEITVAVGETAMADRTVVNAASATSNFESIPIYGRKCTYPQFTVEEGSIVTIPETMSRWQKKNEETGKWEFEKEDAKFTTGTYRAETQVRIDSKDYVLGQDFVLTVNGKPWTTETLHVFAEYSFASVHSKEIIITEPKPILVTSGNVAYEINLVTGEAMVTTLAPDCPDDVDIFINQELYESQGTAYPVTSIRQYAFSRSAKMLSVTIPETVKSIGENAFFLQEKLQRITCFATVPPAALEEAATAAAEVGTFSQWCFDNVTLTVPAEAEQAYRTTAPWSKFKTIETLAPAPKEVIFGGIRYILDTRDDGTPVATAIRVEEMAEEMSVSETVTDPATGTEHTVVAIGDWCFAQWYGINTIYLPKTIESIGDGAFYGISSLKWLFCDAQEPPAVLMQNDVEGIFGTFDEHCFQEVNLVIYGYGTCRKYKRTAPWSQFRVHYFSYTEEEYLALFVNEEQKEVEIAANPNAELTGDVVIDSKLTDGEGNEFTVTKVSDRAFAGQVNITSVTIPETVKSLGSSVFDGCTALKEIECQSATPPSAISGTSQTKGTAARVATRAGVTPTFDDATLQNVKLIVPNGSREQYRNTEPWSGFVTIEEKSSSGIEGTEIDTDTTPAAVFSADGQRRATMQKGVNIVRMSDGTTRKVTVR